MKRYDPLQMEICTLTSADLLTSSVALGEYGAQLDEVNFSDLLK